MSQIAYFINGIDGEDTKLNGKHRTCWAFWAIAFHNCLSPYQYWIFGNLVTVSLQKSLLGNYLLNFISVLMHIILLKVISVTENYPCKLKVTYQLVKSSLHAEYRLPSSLMTSYRQILLWLIITTCRSLNLLRISNLGSYSW